MQISGIPELSATDVQHDHSFVFDAHNSSKKELITRYRGTVVQKAPLGTVITAWQKSIYHFGGLTREVPIVVTLLLDDNGSIRKVAIDEKSCGSQGRRCDFSCLQELTNEKLKNVPISSLSAHVSSAGDVKCLHLFEILAGAASFYDCLRALELSEGAEQELVIIAPDKAGLTAANTHEICGKRDFVMIRLDHRSPVRVNGEYLPAGLDAGVRLSPDGEQEMTEDLCGTDFETVYAQLNRLFSKCQHREKRHFGLSGRVKFSNYPSMVGLFLLTMSHESMSGGPLRAVKIENILRYLQTDYGKHPCKGFGG